MARTEIVDRFHYEREVLRAGVTRIAGVDEVGRGPLAGPVVAAVVVFPREWIRDGMPEAGRGLNDSKQLSASRREQFFQWLISGSGIEFALEQVEARRIDEVNILRATHQAMAGALAALPTAPEHVLVDGLRVEALGNAQTALVKGDSLSYSIAAASVIAKVTRDRWMTEADLQWPGYGFAVHKGYPTPEHLRALARLGPCPIHRRSFAPVAAAASQLALF
ncbi:MAG: ribonuclease HII [Verrucomicrobiales bacterium]|nr:ribonuclease HII [Verrucomicrobiales bacterium]